MTPFDTAVRELRAILAADPSSPEWRWHVRVRLQAVQETLAPAASAPSAASSQTSPSSQTFRPDGPSGSYRPGGEDADGWLAPRAEGTDRRAVQLRARVGVVASGVLDRLDAPSIQRQVRRLLHDLEHLLQRDHDLVYDSVSLDLGGSE